MPRDLAARVISSPVVVRLRRELGPEMPEATEEGITLPGQSERANGF